jgi:hypothetical protein
VFRAVHLPLAAITVRVPLTWSLFPGRAPLVATVNSGPAVVAIWRYPRRAASAGGSEVRAAQRKLIARARARDPQLRLISTRIRQVDGVAAVELTAMEEIGGHPREVSSLHVFRPRSELVLEEYAPPRLFNALDRTIFSRVRQSLTLSATATA